MCQKKEKPQKRELEVNVDVDKRVLDQTRLHPNVQTKNELTIQKKEMIQYKCASGGASPFDGATPKGQSWFTQYFAPALLDSDTMEERQQSELALKTPQNKTTFAIMKD